MKLLLVIISAFFTTVLFAQQSDALKQADSLIALTQYNNARASIERSLKIAGNYQQAALLKNKLAEILILQGNLEESDTELKSIALTQNDFIDAITLTNIGFLHLNRGRYDLSLENLLNAQEKFQKSGKMNTKEGARCVSTLGSLYGATRKYNQAEESQLIALQIREKLFGPESEEVAASYNDLGTIYLETDPDKALDYFEKAYNTYKKIHGKDHPKIAISNTNMGFAYRKLELYGDAINDFEEANRIWQMIYPEGHPNQALVLSFLGQTYRQMKDAKTAESLYSKSLQIFQKSYGIKHPDISKIHIELGLLHLESMKYEEALNAFQNSIIANTPVFSNTDINTNPMAHDYYSGLGLLYSLRYKAQALESNYFGSSLKRNDLALALSCLHICDTLISDIRYQSSAELDKLALGEIASEVFEDGVRIAHLLSEMTLNKKHYEELSFYFAEKSKSAILQESIADTQAKSFAGIPASLLEDEKNLKAEITLTSQQLALKPDAEKEKSLRDKLYRLNTTYNNFIRGLELQYPEYYNLKFNQTTPGVLNIQSTIDSKTALVSYFLAERNKRIYQFIITKNTFRINNLTLPADFDRITKGFNNSLYYSNFEVYKSTSQTLSRILVPKLPQSITHLIIIPAGRLSTLPFEALSIKSKNATDFKNTSYLNNRFATRYEFSSSLLLQKVNQQTQSDNQNILLCAPVKFPTRDFLAELPGTEQEVLAIASMFKESATVIKYEDANESEIKTKNLSDYRYLHFATHGVVDEENPELSRIFLNNGKSDDGDLYAGEIYNLKMKSDLTVLSACQTGLGKISKGEGVIGLSRALTYAGTKRIIVSFWQVADKSTSLLMTDFYKNLLENKMDYASALQKAKNKLLKEDNFSNPYYWAPFVLIGF